MVEPSMTVYMVIQRVRQQMPGRRIENFAYKTLPDGTPHVIVTLDGYKPGGPVRDMKLEFPDDL